MKFLPKIVSFLSLISLILVMSCGSDDGEGNDLESLENVEFTFDLDNLPLDEDLIDNMFSSSDPNALQIAAQLSTANALSSYLSFFAQAENIEPNSTSPIGTCGGNALVYTFSSSADGQSLTVSYQICETQDKYIFQMFFSMNGSELMPFIYAEESKSDLRKGLMNVFELDPDRSNDDPLFTYTWEENTDGSFEYLARGLGTDGFLTTVNINADNSGSMTYEFDGMLRYEATWNTAGTAGTYTVYSNGVEVESGVWP